MLRLEPDQLRADHRRYVQLRAESRRAMIEHLRTCDACGWRVRYNCAASRALLRQNQALAAVVQALAGLLDPV